MLTVFGSGRIESASGQMADSTSKIQLVALPVLCPVTRGQIGPLPHGGLHLFRNAQWALQPIPCHSTAISTRCMKTNTTQLSQEILKTCNIQTENSEGRALKKNFIPLKKKLSCFITLTLMFQCFGAGRQAGRPAARPPGPAARPAVCRKVGTAATRAELLGTAEGVQSKGGTASARAEL